MIEFEMVPAGAHGAVASRRQALRIHIDKQEAVCAYCACEIASPPRPGALPATLEHIVPTSLGGEHTMRNTCAICTRCNRVRSNLTVEELLRMARRIDLLVKVRGL